MAKQNKIALLLAGTVLLNTMATTLTACSSKEKNETSIEISETSIDTKDIVIIDTYNSNVSKKGINERYLILYKIGTEHDEKLDTPMNKSTSYIYRDVNNKEYVGVFTEYTDKRTIFVYAKEDLSSTEKSIVVPITDDKSWYGGLENIIEKDHLKPAYEIYELLEIYNLLNEAYKDEKDSNETIYAESLSYKLLLDN